MKSSTSRKRYHVVCRECRVEGLFDVADDAADLERDHAAETGHRVAVGRVD
ncbi:hypothetical protein [Halorubrum sp. CBA1125]|uniref:hypothetical protein n=1 Tax=Halorubrum sp. CBA1125 TaxID=2668072 RepID=UPI0018D219D6|nr:hypothetical protein [Halorubrum sp. CBA1125]